MSMLEALSEWMGYPMHYARGGQAPERSGTRHATIAPYGDVRTGDGQSVVLAVQNQDEWARFCREVLREPELADDPRFRTNPKRVENRMALFEVIEMAFSDSSREEVVERLRGARIAYADLNEVSALARHPQLLARERFRDVDSPVGALSTLVPPADIEGVEPAMGPIPDLGEHTDKTLLDLGYSPESIEQMRREGVI